MKPLAIDLFCGLGGWSDGLLAEGWRVIGYDIERHEYGGQKYPGELVLQDVLTIHGSALKDADLIVASPPCQEFSYMAMPWSRAKAIEKEYLSGKRDRKNLTALFDACFRIQREASEAAGHHIPLVVENVRGAQKWVGKARWNFGSYYLWGDVPALMPITARRGVMKQGIAHRPNGETNFHGQKVPGFRFDGSGKSFQSESVQETGFNNPNGGSWDRSRPSHTTDHSWHKMGEKGPAAYGSKSNACKAASAMIAKIPFPLAQWIARTFKPKIAL